MISREAIESELRRRLPGALYSQAPVIAGVLTDLVQRKLPPDQARAQLDSPAIIEALHMLVGQNIPVSNRGDYISIGDISNAKNVAVGRSAIAIESLVIDLHVTQAQSRLALIVALASVVALALLIVFVVVRPGIRPAPRLPAPSRLALVGLPQQAIGALALSGSDLWIGAREGQRSALYRLDMRKGSQALPEKVIDLDAEILALAVDCRDNIWIAMLEIGTRVYHPATGQLSMPLNRQTTADQLPRNSMQALAARCSAAGTPEVWLGRIGVRAVTYGGDTLDERNWTIQVPPALSGTPTIDDVRAIMVLTDTDELWVAGDSTVVALSFRGVLPARVHSFDDPHVWSISRAPDGSIWAGGTRSLFHFHADRMQWETFPLVNADKTTLHGQAYVLAADQEWIWAGDPRCAAEDQLCWPLSVWSDGAIYPVPIQQRQVLALARDPTGNIWIGTEAGLIVYPAHDSKER